MFRFLSMLFWLRDAPGSIQQAAEIILTSVQWQYKHVYLSDIVTYLRNTQKRIGHFRKVSTLRREIEVKPKLESSKFSTETIDYVSDVIFSIRLEFPFHTTGTIRGLKAPNNFTKLQPFQLLWNVFRALLPSFARLVAPLNQRLKKEQPPTLGSPNEIEPNFVIPLNDALMPPSFWHSSTSADT